MSVLALRALAASAAAAVVIAVSFWVSTGPSDSAVAFDKVLERVAEAETLHLQIARGGKTEQVWAKQPHQLRWDEGGGRYKIAKRDRLWLVDEEANQAAAQTRPTWWLRATRYPENDITKPASQAPNGDMPSERASAYMEMPTSSRWLMTSQLMAAGEGRSHEIRSESG